ncbi:hypothetical protein Nepgr_031051 [Nepenthes gracilis]|uniref:Fe2OG dioxygenase domain-containing protein n=1 Tax=Nepenthes gracilis TaxID=150966 RepID=A0AAD3TFV7_NEPGR|nr:hypothetical protein Nepgr_031051 [Nepenthes gracilis]
MVTTAEVEPSQYDRMAELKAFDETKAGVKGLLDAGVTKLPRIFVNEQSLPLDQLPVVGSDSQAAGIPVIDLDGASDDPAKRKETVKEILDACGSWGFFQIINHGIPQSMLDEIRDGVRKFHEQPTAAKKAYYSREPAGKKFIYVSNRYLFKGPVTNWRDTITAIMAPNPVDPEDFPEVCRDIIIEYSKEVIKLGHLLFELFSEGMGLSPNHLTDMDCEEQMMLLGQYYPPCPEPEKAIGINNHKDNDFLTVLLQDHIGGLQVLHEDKWVEVPYMPGALVINTGDLLQLVSNDKFLSVLHRVQSKKVGPRISVAAFFRPVSSNKRLFAPIKELLSEVNPPIYGECTGNEYLQTYFQTGQDGTPALDPFKL